MAAERAILVGVDWHRDEFALLELRELAETAGAEVAGLVQQRRDRPDPAYFIGPGKAEELGEEVKALAATLIIFDAELSPAQQRNLEKAAGVRVIDRTDLILDIFAQRARTKEARLQVELAQLDYLLPRLGGQGLALSRLGGGIGTRGPGETKLESDRRRVRHQIVILRRELMEVKAQRDLMRRPRQRAGAAIVALVGYTNAGKSTLFNTLTGEAVLTEDKLFATLDPTLRQLPLSGRSEVILADTVGFIRRLPTQLIAAFRATLEEVAEADLLLQIMDASAPDLAAQAQAVHTVLQDLGCGSHPMLPVLNKIDLLDEATLAARKREWPGAIAISARHDRGLDQLQQAIADFFAARRSLRRLFLPFSAGDVLSRLHEAGAVRAEEYRENGIEVMVELDPIAAERVRRYWVEDRDPQAGES